MSTDFDVICDRCKKVRHLGQCMAAAVSFGFGSNDEEGRRGAAEWIFAHLGCNPSGLRVVNSDVDCPDDYQYVHDEKAPDNLPSFWGQ